jgi:uncharacterized phage protein (TIGR02218 family)
MMRRSPKTDIAAGRYDAAEVELWRVDWMRSDLRVRLWKGRLARIRRENGRFVADLDGPMAALEPVVGRTYGRGCDAVLGDGRCRLGAAAVAGPQLRQAVGDLRGGLREWGQLPGISGHSGRGLPDGAAGGGTQ